MLMCDPSGPDYTAELRVDLRFSSTHSSPVSSLDKAKEDVLKYVRNE